MQRRERLALGAVGLTACLGAPPAGHPEPFSDVDTTLIDAHLECDPVAEAWSITVDTNGWTGGGRVYLAARDAWLNWQVESHFVPSRDATADGSTDHLGAEIAIAAVPEAAEPGSSSRFTCADAPDGLVVVYRLRGGIAACAVVAGSAAPWHQIGPECPDG